MLPCQTSRFGWPSAVHVLAERVEPAQLAGEVLVGGPAERVEPGRAGQEVHREIEPHAGPEQVLDLGSGSSADIRGKLGQRQIGRPQARCRPWPSWPRYLGDKGEVPWPAPRNLSTVSAQVVGLDDRRAGCRPSAAG